jgi:hypothetical protein
MRKLEAALLLTATLLAIPIGGPAAPSLLAAIAS